jgi:hypothetical protein
MDQTTLLLEFLKYQWEERRHHQTSEVSATAFLTAAAGVVLGFAFKENQPIFASISSGVIVVLVGYANWRINRAYFIANRFRNAMGWSTRQVLEKAIKDWSVETATEIRKLVKDKQEPKGLDISIGEEIHTALMYIPIATMFIGLLVTLSPLAMKLKLSGAFPT